MVGFFFNVFKWASLVVQLVKNWPAMQEIWVRPLGWRKERLPTQVFWPGEFHGLYNPRGRKESDTTEQLSLTFLELLLASTGKAFKILNT